MYDRKEGGRSRTAGMDDVATMAERTHERTNKRTVERENVKQIAKEERERGKRYGRAESYRRGAAERVESTIFPV